MNPWLLIVIAGILETAWALGLKYSEGFTKFWPSAFTVVTALGSFWLLSLAMKSLPVGTAYAVWVGIGAVGTIIVGVALGLETLGLARGLLLMGLVGCVVGLKLIH